MNAMSDKYIDRELISNMLFGEEKYIIEFSEASIQSFSEFSDNFAQFLLARDIESLRKAGHKIKPVALMLNVNVLMDLYEEAKVQISTNQSDQKLKETADTVQDVCSRVVDEFKELI
jgi:hypothetical protein